MFEPAVIVKVKPDEGYLFLRPYPRPLGGKDVYAKYWSQDFIGEAADPEVGDRVMYMPAEKKATRPQAAGWQFIELSKRYASLSAEEIELAKDVLGIHLGAFRLGRRNVVTQEGEPLAVYQGSFPGSPEHSGTLGQVLLWAWLYARDLKMAGLPPFQHREYFPHFVVSVLRDGKKIADPDTLPFYLASQAAARAEILNKVYPNTANVVPLWPGLSRRLRTEDLPNLLNGCVLTRVAKNHYQWYDESADVLVANGHKLDDSTMVTVDRQEYAGAEMSSLFSYGRWEPAMASAR